MSHKKQLFDFKDELNLQKAAEKRGYEDIKTFIEETYEENPRGRAIQQDQNNWSLNIWDYGPSEKMGDRVVNMAFKYFPSEITESMERK